MSIYDFVIYKMSIYDMDIFCGIVKVCKNVNDLY